MLINPELVALAQWRLNELQKQTEKTAFVPPGAGDPSQQGGDPSQGGAPPMDPSQGGGGAPMDPSMASGAGGGQQPVAGGGGLNADSIAQIVTQTMQQQQMGGGAGGGGMGGGGAGGAGKMVKPDIATVAIDIFQVKKMLQYLFNSMGIPIPPDILDGPNRDPSTGTPMPPGAPGSTSDPSVTAQNAQQMQPQGGGGQPQQQPGGQQGGALSPIEPMQPGVGGEKMSSDRTLYMGDVHSETSFNPQFISRAAALSAIVRKLSKG